MDQQPETPAGSDELLEASWDDRGRAVRGRELGLELLMTAGFAAGVAMLLALGPAAAAPQPIVWALVVAYAIAARADFPVGSGHVVPTQLFLVPMFAVAPAPLVPALVFAGLALGLLGEVALAPHARRPARLLRRRRDARARARARDHGLRRR